MKGIAAVARLDLQRLSFPLLACALVAGLAPAFASGIGSRAPVAEVLALTFLLVGVTAGGTFGYDFAEGRGAFFFARPLSSFKVIAGRILSVVALAAGCFIAVMAASRLSASDPAAFRFFILTRSHLYGLLIAWTVGLHLGLAVAVRARAEEETRGLAGIMGVVVRVPAVLAVVLLVFGLFADLVLRAYRSEVPARLFFGAWVAGALTASILAIVAGRADRLRIARVQNATMIGVAIAISAAVIVAWLWALNPGPANIVAIGEVRSSPDGRFAYVETRVDRGDPSAYHPTFVLDLGTGSARLLKADPYQGPWPSADGAVMAWSGAAPVFFRPLLQKFGGGSHYRLQIGDAAPVPLELPARLRAASGLGAAFLATSPISITPSPDGDTYALDSSREVTFMSRSRGELASVRLPGRGGFSGLRLRFLPGGHARAAFVAEAAGGAEARFVDIDTRTGRLTVIASLPAPNIASIELDRSGSRALVTTREKPISGAAPVDAAVRLKQARTGSSFLLALDAPGASPSPRPLVAGAQSPWSLFLGDGRVVTTFDDAGGRSLLVSSAEGAPLATHALAPNSAWVGSEMFPGVVAIVRRQNGPDELDLVDCASGATLRTLTGYRATASAYAGTPRMDPPPGSPGARLLASRDGRLYELPSLREEPRLLLPQPRL